MIQKAKTEGDRVRVWFAFESWKEYFTHFREYFEYEADRGSYHRGYLPVSREDHRLGYRVWILPLAPFALLVVALVRGFREFWWTLVDAIDKWPKK